MNNRNLIRHAMLSMTVATESEDIKDGSLSEYEGMLDADNELLSEIDDSADDASDVIESVEVVEVVENASVNSAELGDALAKVVEEGGVSAESLILYNTALESLIRAHRLPISTEDFQVSVENYGDSKTRLECSMEALEKAIELFKRFWEGLKQAVRTFIQKVMNFVRSFKEVGQKIRKAGVALQDGIKTLDGKNGPASIPKTAGKAWTSALIVGGGNMIVDKKETIITPSQAISRLNEALDDMVVGYPASVFIAILPIFGLLNQKKPFIDLKNSVEELYWGYKGRTYIDVPGCKAVWIDDKDSKASSKISLETLSRRVVKISKNDVESRFTQDAPTLTKQDLVTLARDLIKTGEKIGTLEREAREFDKITNDFMKAGDTYTKESVEAGWNKGEIKTLLSQLRQCITHHASFMAVYLPYMAGICQDLYKYGAYSISVYR